MTITNDTLLSAAKAAGHKTVQRKYLENRVCIKIGEKAPLWTPHIDPAQCFWLVLDTNIEIYDFQGMKIICSYDEDDEIIFSTAIKLDDPDYKSKIMQAATQAAAAKGELL